MSRLPKQRYTPEQVETALTVLALRGGNSREASEHLAASDLQIPSSTLRLWRTETHADRYVEICQERAPEIEKRVIQRSQEVQQRALDVSLKAVNKAEEQLDAGEAKDPAATAKNLALSFAVITDKSLLLQGRPNVMVGNQDARDLLNEIRRDLAIPGTAEELPPEALTAGTDEPNARD